MPKTQKSFLKIHVSSPKTQISGLYKKISVLCKNQGKMRRPLCMLHKGRFCFSLFSLIFAIYQHNKLQKLLPNPLVIKFLKPVLQFSP